MSPVFMSVITGGVRMSPVFMSVFIYRRCEDVPCVYVSVHLQEV